MDFGDVHIDLVQLATLITALGAVILGFMNRGQIVSANYKIDLVEKNTNSLVEKMGVAKVAEGVLKEQSEQAKRDLAFSAGQATNPLPAEKVEIAADVVSVKSPKSEKVSVDTKIK